METNHSAKKPKTANKPAARKPAGNKSRQPAKHYTPSKSDTRRKLRRTLKMLAWCIAILIVICIVALMPYALSGAPKAGTLHIPQGATQQAVTDSLTRLFGEEYSGRVATLLRMLPDSKQPRPGAYLIEEGMSPMRTVIHIVRGGQSPVRISFNKVRHPEELASRLAAKLEPDSAAFLAAMGDEELLSEAGLTYDQRLALFIEDTHEFHWSYSPEKVIDKYLRHYNEVWNKERRDKAAALGLTPAEVMTICSIVDEETNDNSEKGKVGRLYINRLKKGMRLQSDPTVRYALGDFTIKRVTKEHLGIDSPYNTYRNNGLPPGPICTTSVKTIDAVLNSEPSDYLYMCAKEDFSGSHYFTADWAEHQQNARKYQNALNERGIH